MRQRHGDFHTGTGESVVIVGQSGDGGNILRHVYGSPFYPEEFTGEHPNFEEKFFFTMKAMKTKIIWPRKIRLLASILWLLFMGLFKTIYAVLNKQQYYGMRFFLFGQSLGFRYLAKWKYEQFKAFLLSPLVLFRYPEFSFAYNSLEWDGKGILDVSSPNLFSAFLCKKHNNIHVSMYNPDGRDMSSTQTFFGEIDIPRQKIAYLDCLPECENFFDIIVSISVIEHVVENEVPSFLQKIWNLLHRNGNLVLTFPVARKYRIEYRDFNTYALDVPRNDDGKYFYQRVYDDKTIEEQIVAIWADLGGSVKRKKIYGLKEGFDFQEYTKRRLQYGRAYHNNDVFVYKRYLRPYVLTNDLPDRGICGLVLSKPGPSDD